MKKALSLLLLPCLLLSGCGIKNGKNPSQSTTDQSTAPPLIDNTSTSEPKTEPPRPVFSEEELELLFPPYRQTGMLLQDADALTAGLTVEIRYVESGESVVVLSEGEEYTVPWDTVTATVPETPPLPEVSPETVGIAADSMGLESETPYLVWTDLWRLSTYLLERDADGRWQCIAVLPAAVGALSHPTPKGLYKIDYHEMFLGREDAYLCFYTLRFHGDYLYHSILYDWAGDVVQDGRLSARVSLGCIRHSLEDSRMLYETVPDGTAVLIR